MEKYTPELREERLDKEYRIIEPCLLCGFVAFEISALSWEMMGRSQRLETYRMMAKNHYRTACPNPLAKNMVLEW